jgi:hypothetical protein
VLCLIRALAAFLAERQCHRFCQPLRHRVDQARCTRSGNWNGARCRAYGAEAVSERPEWTAQCYHRCFGACVDIG